MINKIPKHLKIVIIFFSFLMCILIIVKIKNDTNPQKILEEKKEQIYNLIDKTIFVDVSKYTIYSVSVTSVLISFNSEL